MTQTIALKPGIELDANLRTTSARSILKDLVRNNMSVFGLMLVLILILPAVFAQFLPLSDPLKMNSQFTFQSPNGDFLLGTDSTGRDILSRLIYGSRVSFYVAFLSVAIAGSVGTVIGIVSGYFAGYVESILMRIMDVLFSFPAVLLGLAIISAFGPGDNNVILAIAVVYTPIFSRVALGSTRSVREREFVTSARAIGCNDSRIILRHVFPNILAPVIVQVSLALSWALLTEALFSFLGVGVQPPAPAWGIMLDEGRRYMEYAPWIAVFPGIAISMAVLGFNLFGDGLRDVLDPRLRD